MAIKRSKERIDKTGEIFTPIELVNEILNKLPQESFVDSKKTFIDPACGDGNFLVEIVKQKIKSGSSQWQALSTTFGIDIMQDNVDECRQRLLKAANAEEEKYVDLVNTTIVCGDSTKQTIDELFAEYEKKYGEEIKTA